MEEIKKCNECERENPAASKYCRCCGYELPKFVDKTKNQNDASKHAYKQQHSKEFELDEYNKGLLMENRKLKLVLCILLVLLHFIAFFYISSFFSKFTPAGMGGIAVDFFLIAVNFVVLSMSLAVSVKCLNKNPIYSLIAFISGVMLTIIVDFLIFYIN